MHLDVALVVPDTEAEGPGRRFAIWVQGCPFRCAGCCNPEMLPREGGQRLSVAELEARLLASSALEGISLLGGEPFAQAEGCAVLAQSARRAGLSVMIYSGFTREELEGRRRGPGIAELLDACDVLVDGRYERDLPETKRRWIGSSNQRTHFLTDRYSTDDPRFVAANTIEVRVRRGEIVANGWPQGVTALLSRARQGNPAKREP
jgi:anaerobic ribonucleoside-triphosphate reductase activating protein